MKNFLIFILTILTILSCKENSQKENNQVNSLESIKQGKKIRVGYIPYYDITFKDIKTRQVDGFLVEFLGEVFKDINIPKENIEFIETDWQNFGVGLKNNKYDLSIAGTFKTPQREKIVSFTEPIFYLGNGAAVRKDDNRFNSINDFDKEGIKIAVVQGEQGHEYAKKNMKNAQLIELSGADLSLAPLQVKKGLADAAFSDQYILRRFISTNPDLKDVLSDDPYYVLPVCWALSQKEEDKTFLSYLNQRINKLKSDGTLNRLTQKYSDKIPFASVDNIDE